MRGVHITLRMRLECKIVRRDPGEDVAVEERYEVMNEVVVDRGANPYLAKIECWERDTLITKVSALLRMMPALRLRAALSDMYLRSLCCAPII